MNNLLVVVEACEGKCEGIVVIRDEAALVIVVCSHGTIERILCKRYHELHCIHVISREGFLRW